MTTIVNGEELTNEEWQNEINEALNAFDIDSHLDALNEEHSQYFNKLISDFGYVDIYDLIMCANTNIPENTYFDEAFSIKVYYFKTWVEIKDYIATNPTAETQKTLLEIISPFNNE